ALPIYFGDANPVPGVQKNSNKRTLGHLGRVVFFGYIPKVDKRMGFGKLSVHDFLMLNAIFENTSS
ncbi:MAG: hypothetical protein AAF998_27325, partial [Bacteroidota bacterium]